METYFRFTWENMDWQHYAPLLIKGRPHVDEEKLKKSPAHATGWYKGKHLIVPVKITQNNGSLTTLDAIGKVIEIELYNFHNEEQQLLSRGRFKEAFIKAGRSSQHDLRLIIEVLQPYKP
jgi:hypothetical protein